MSDTTQIFQRVRDAARIEEIIGEHIALRPAGRELVGLCPFHEDRRPSMYVSPQKQIFYCFVCASGGDVFRFVRNYHKMTAGEALRFLAQRYGVQLPDYHGPTGAGREEASQREKMVAANGWAAKYFQENLAAEAGKTALQYLHSRGLTDAVIGDFQLGFALEHWTALAQAAGRHGIAEEQLVAVGLLKRRADGSPFDMLRNRIIFPIYNVSDQLIGFGGRILPAPDGAAAPPAAAAGAEAAVSPKYLNSPETALFSKRETLYALNRARPAIIRTRTAVVVEGYMDVIACHQCGVSNVVATLGTAMTDRHISLLRRFCERLILVFDTDEAGRRAADRAIELLLHFPLDVRITHVPDGKDPCDFCMARGGKAFEELLVQAQDALEYKWRQFVEEFQVSRSLAHKQEASTVMLRLVATALGPRGTDPIRRGLLEKQLADLIGISADEVHHMIRRQGQAPGSQSSSAPAPVQVAGTAKPTGAAAGRWRSQQWILGALLCDFSLYHEFHQDITLDLFPSEPLASLAGRLLEYLDGAADVEQCLLADFLGALDDSSLLRAAMEAQAEAESGGYQECRSPVAEPAAEMDEEMRQQRRDQLRQKIADALSWLKKEPDGASTAGPTTAAEAGATPPAVAAGIDLAADLRQAQEAHRLGLNRRVLGPRQ